MKKLTIHKENIALINTYVTKLGASKNVKQMLMDIKGDINRNMVIAGDLTHH